MSNNLLREEAIQVGEGGRLCGILTSPGALNGRLDTLPLFVFLNAGLLHRVGPSRLYVLLARELAGMGFGSVRFDLAGRGDSSPRHELTHQHSVEADYDEILRSLEARFGRLRLVLAGLCSGADNAIRLTLKDPRVVGMVLLDPICFPDDGFWVRAFWIKYMNVARYIAWLRRRFDALIAPGGKREELADALGLRDLPSVGQLQAAFQLIRERKGRVLSVFTQYALRYYNQRGQLGRILGVDGYDQFCTELFWPHAEHTYRLELHRRQLIEEIKIWAARCVSE